MLQRIQARFSAVVVLAGVLWILPVGSASAGSTTYDFSLVPPAPAFDLSTLDARDEFNRPIRSPEVRRSLESLFVHSLHRMLRYGLTPLRRQRDALLAASWRWHETLRRALSRFKSAIRAIAPDNQRRGLKAVARFQERIVPLAADAFGPAELCQAVFQSSLISSIRLQR